MSIEQTHATFDADLRKLADLVVAMIDSCDEQLAKAMESLIKQNNILASQTVRKDAEVNEQQHKIDEQTLKALALRQPVATDLRRIIAAGKMAADLERIADYSSNIANNGLRLNQPGQDLSAKFGQHLEMAAVAHKMLQEVKTAYQSFDSSEVEDMWQLDAEIDAMFSKIMGEVQSSCTISSDDNEQVETMTRMSVGRALERIGDHIVNLAEHIVFAVTGRKVVKSGK